MSRPSHNLHRRHLTESQRGLIAGKLANMKTGDNQHGRSEVSPLGETYIPTAQAAEMLNVSKRTAERGRKLALKGIPELAEAAHQRPPPSVP